MLTGVTVASKNKENNCFSLNPPSLHGYAGSSENAQTGMADQKKMLPLSVKNKLQSVLLIAICSSMTQK